MHSNTLFCSLALWTALILGGGTLYAQENGVALFDGETLQGWESKPSDSKWWTVVDGVLRGGSLEENIPHNTFLATQQSFHNFELTLSIRLAGSGGLVNSGIQIRSVRVEGSSEMRGYQVDAGDGWWGKLYDESRRNRVISEPVSADELGAAVNSDGWNEYRIRAEGPRIRSWINGVLALDYMEVDGQIPLDGHIGIQVHSGGRVQVEVKDIQLEELPPTPGAMTWRRWDKAQSVSSQGSAPIRNAQEELEGFHVLEEFEVELVTADPLVNKVVDIAFDDGGRMWAITAVEYPIDGNESDAVAELYESGGRDQVLVFDEPWKSGPHTPRVFADGLFIPMAILPRTHDVLIGMGSNIFSLHDDDGDGRADRREVILSGFGIQDSHLLPHRFVRAPGDWVYLAQGAFNSSQVRTKSGETVTFNKCKLGRFRTDGSRFEVVGVGLNNIWGFVLDRLGDKWIQEANDLGYPLISFEHGRSYPGIGMERFHDYSPWHPSYATFSMGGTGLSGLALSQDANGFPAPWDETFFLANPIINAVQSVRVSRDENAPSELKMERVRDLMTSEDKNFRPVAIHFGPDGCLYVVDWYNPIISHNEVPRDHPDRDRSSSRIWRIRHRSQERQAPIDVA
ncbi:MAG: putative membrane-bound dehydrogenase-like protein, partial [Candidatus Paceibacteria bacterium]